jgi:uncharacterized membrane protein
MDDLAIVLAVHVLSIVLWIGGVGFATIALLPALRRAAPFGDPIAIFEAVESRFAPVARSSIIVAGVTGLYMIVRLDAWSWFTALSYWWMHAMVLVWALFFALLFVIEPLLLQRRFTAVAKAAPDTTFRRMQHVHWILLALGLLTVAAAVAGSHGLFG